jgi:hypothetical protein
MISLSPLRLPSSLLFGPTASSEVEGSPTWGLRVVLGKSEPADRRGLAAKWTAAAFGLDSTHAEHFHPTSKVFPLAAFPESTLTPPPDFPRNTIA